MVHGYIFYDISSNRQVTVDAVLVKKMITPHSIDCSLRDAFGVIQNILKKMVVCIC